MWDEFETVIGNVIVLVVGKTPTSVIGIDPQAAVRANDCG